MTRWNDQPDVPRGEEYDAQLQARAEPGQWVHGEADLIELLLTELPTPRGTRTVLDAGCGTGRVAIELANRDIEVVGVDLDPIMLATARAKAPGLTWIEGDLASVAISEDPNRDGALTNDEGAVRAFDLIALPGNVMIFVEPGSEARVVANLARHLAPGGSLVAGFQLRIDRLSLEAYDTACVTAGLVPSARWSTWDREPFSGGDYAVSVHVRPVE